MAISDRLITIGRKNIILLKEVNILKYTKGEGKVALKMIDSIIFESEKVQPKFKEGTPQFSLLKNRIKSLEIVKALIVEENIIDKYTKEELVEALPPIISIISKCQKAILKFKEGQSHHTRLQTIIETMTTGIEYINIEIEKEKN